MIGGVMRDKNGRWILGYNQFLGSCSILEVELWGILNSLVIALDRGFDSLIFLSDNLEAVQAIQVSYSRVLNSALVRRIRQLLAKPMQWSIYHVSREDNKEIDELTRMTIDKKKEACNYLECPQYELGHNLK
ncbi:hypothetical protein Gohar_021855 [Gossypium harknessii]|uniref:RNase H type-1 domain-containing protein n=1 Tax=Gossypium harknessii TaxID=34285 RepID=A0A7J9I7D3_9ROSI|nr:hypothetical protein [Gossypium harknessii]